MYQLITGPLLWLCFGVFFIGIIVRIVRYIKGLNWQMDRVTYRVNVSYGIKGAARSIFFWIFPFGTRSWRSKPGMTILFFVFHIALLITPIFLLAHNLLIRERLGISWVTIPGPVADILTIAVIVCAVFLALRRLAYPEVRILTTAYDYFLLLVAVAPFITGFLASHNAAGYTFWFMAHIICGEIMLVLIPFTKLSHMILFFLSRAQLGMDFGIKRGGMKGKGMAW